jgi:gluconolactonase
MMCCLVLGVLLVGGAAGAGELVIVPNIRGPEGPLIVDGTLYYVGWVSDTLSKWDGRASTILNHTPGCGHNGLALTRQKTLLVACDNVQARSSRSTCPAGSCGAGTPTAGVASLKAGSMTSSVAANGGAYATLSGPDNDIEVMGTIFYMAPGAQQWVEVADNLNYANGIGISPDQKTLYVSETVGNSIKKFRIRPDGSLSNRSNFALLNLLVKDTVKAWSLGPDSMKIDRAGNMYVAQWRGAKVLKISPDGKLLHVFEISSGDGTTNLAFDEGENNLYVTVVKDSHDPQALGSIVMIHNVR